MAMKGAEVLAVQSLQRHLGDANLKRFINFTLKVRKSFPKLFLNHS